MVQGSDIYCDNLFTFPLLNKMSKMGIGCMGTVRQNRLNKVPLPNKNDVLKSGVDRGTVRSVYQEDMTCKYSTIQYSTVQEM